MTNRIYKKQLVVLGCVYMITNSATGRVYIGATGTDIRHRFTSHKSELRRGKHPVSMMQKDFDKYGESSFSISILEEVKDTNILHKVEASWIEKYFDNGVNCYNKTKYTKIDSAWVCK